MADGEHEEWLREEEERKKLRAQPHIVGKKLRLSDDGTKKPGVTPEEEEEDDDDDDDIPEEADETQSGEPQ